jgi:hypothetical protein
MEKQMGYRGNVRGEVVVLRGGTILPEGTEVEVTPVATLPRGTPAALLEVGVGAAGRCLGLGGEGGAGLRPARTDVNRS